MAKKIFENIVFFIMQWSVPLFGAAAAIQCALYEKWIGVMFFTCMALSFLFIVWFAWAYNDQNGYNK